MTFNHCERTRSRCIYNLSGHPSGSTTGGVDSPPRIALRAVARGDRSTSAMRSRPMPLRGFSRLLPLRRRPHAQLRQSYEYPHAFREARHPLELLYHLGIWNFIEIAAVAVLRPRIADLVANLEIGNDLAEPAPIVDDVITTGAHFVAAKPCSRRGPRCSDSRGDELG